MRKRHCFIIANAAIFAVIIAFTSCKNISGDIEQPPAAVYLPPVVHPLKFSKPVKLNWDSIKAVPVHPLVKTFDLDKLPAQSYDTAGFKPFKYPVKEAKLDINALPEKDLDIDKLPSHSLNFITEKLPPPTKLFHAGPPHLKKLNLSLFELGEAQGLASKLITCLFTDRDGFLWIATDKGLYRYDGENLLLYIPVTIPHYIFGMAQDTYGRIWLATVNKGYLEVLDPQDGTLKTAEKSSLQSRISFTNVFKDGEQRIWAPTFSSKGAGIIDPKTQTVKWLDKAHGLPDTTSFAFTQDNSRNTWFAAGKELGMIDASGKKIKYLTNANGFKTDSIINMIFDGSGRLWIAYLDGMLNILDFKRNIVQTIKEIQCPQTSILSLLPDNRGRMWVATADAGLEIIDPENRTARNLKKIDGLNFDACFNVTRDNQQQVWIAGIGGLNMIDMNQAIVERIGKGLVDFLVEDSKGLEWDQSYFTGINIIDRKNKTTRHLGVTQGLGNDTTLQVFEINGKIYIPTNSGLDIIDRTKKTISHIGKAQGFNSTLTLNITADKSGRIWMGENDGLGVYDPINNTVKVIPKTRFFNNDGISSVKAAPGGRIWLSTNSGLVYVVDPFTYRIQKLDRNGLQNGSSDGGCTFLADKNGDMWIGTNHGIYIADIANKTLTSFSVPQGLIDDRTATLLQHGNQIYASTAGGLTIITPPVEGIVTNKKWGAQSFGNAYGLKKLNIAFCLTDAIGSDGNFLWGDYGVTVLDLSKRDTSRPPAYICGMNIMDQPKFFTGNTHIVSNGMSWERVNSASNLPENLQLPHDQNYIQFNFGTLNFVANDTTWYTYKLIGKDTAWSAKTISDHSRNYFGLAPGKYTFEVASKSSDNGWSKPAVFSFTINLPWWQTWWAYILFLLAFGGIVWAIVYLRSQQLIREKRVLEHKVHIRTEEVMQQKEEIEAQRDNLEKAFGELKTTQTQLIQSEKMASLGELTAGIAHEIQNPLNFVNNFSDVNAELLVELKEEIAAKNYEEAIAIADDLIGNEQKINLHGKRADSIVKGMLEHSRTHTGQKELTDINAMADEFMRLSYHGLRAKDKSFNAGLVTHFDVALPMVKAVQQDIGRVMLNLFNNAFYAVNQKAKTAGPGYKPMIEVSTSLAGNQVIISVKDNGIGISDSIKEKIMQPFFTTKPTGEGTGLGLSLTYDMIVKGHGGSIVVNSKEGEGSEFIIMLPAV